MTRATRASRAKASGSTGKSTSKTKAGGKHRGASATETGVPASGLLLAELESQFTALQKKFAKARRNHLAGLQQDVDQARAGVLKTQARLAKARSRSARAAADFRRTGSKATKAKLKTARANSLSLTDALGDARESMVSAQSRLHAAKQLDRRLSARAKVLEKFERDWEKKAQSDAIARAQRAKKAAEKRRNTARKRAAKSPAAKKSIRKGTS